MKRVIILGAAGNKEQAEIVIAGDCGSVTEKLNNEQVEEAARMLYTRLPGNAWTPFKAMIDKARNRGPLWQRVAHRRGDDAHRHSREYMLTNKLSARTRRTAPTTQSSP